MKLLFSPRRRSYALPPMLALLAIGCTAFGAGQRHTERAEWRRSYPLAAGGELSVQNVNGRVRVERGTGDAVEVVAEKTARGSSEADAKDVLDRIEILDDASSSAVRLETRFRRDGRWRSSWQVSYLVRVPAGVRTDLTTVNGGVEADGLDADVRARTTNGGVVLREVAAPVSASTTNGGIELGLARMSGDVSLQCTNGGITLGMPADTRARLSASVVNGGIDTTGVELQVQQSGRRSLEATLNGGGPDVRLRCTNGGIRIRGR